MKRIAFFGGSFDPPHKGHLAIAHELIKEFDLDEFVFIPAYHAPHKVRLQPTSAYDRYAMLCLITQGETKMKVSRMELETPEKPYSVETLDRLAEMEPKAKRFFVMGADSWRDIRTWRAWERVLTISDHIVVTRPGAPVSFEHVTDAVRMRVIDMRKDVSVPFPESDIDIHTSAAMDGFRIYFTDVVNMDISATDIRRKVREKELSWVDDVPVEVANYIEKYQIYS